MAAALVVLMLIFSMVPHSSGTWCVCKKGGNDKVLQLAIDYACGNGADCTQTKQGGKCYNPNTVTDHCNYAVNSYFQAKGQATGSCDFNGAAQITTTDPSANGCTFPSSARLCYGLYYLFDPASISCTIRRHIQYYRESNVKYEEVKYGLSTELEKLLIDVCLLQLCMDAVVRLCQLLLATEHRVPTVTTGGTTTSPYGNNPTNTGVLGGGIGSGMGPSGAGINTDVSHGFMLHQEANSFGFLAILGSSLVMLMWG
ncbi:hypothetical protein OSB04_003289 [Centaurea solstitialis]|uniref:X8 domain-containing protein n=1 Tax=Centaurea solstitialis TaxID=347529 RepID=A0AA38UCC0_9ASTR|nr:hypothetical protein OSB04_003289 [Centaurea solstitialis]